MHSSWYQTYIINVLSTLNTKKKTKKRQTPRPPPKKKPASKSMQKYSYAASCFILTCLIHETKVRSRVQQEGNSVKKIDKVNLIWFYEQNHWNHWNTPVVLTYIVFFICIYTEVCIWIFYSSLGSVLKVFRISNSRYLLTNDYDMHCCDFKRSHFLNNVFFLLIYVYKQVQSFLSCWTISR